MAGHGITAGQKHRRQQALPRKARTCLAPKTARRHALSGTVAIEINAKANKAALGATIAVAETGAIATIARRGKLRRQLRHPRRRNGVMTVRIATAPAIAKTAAENIVGAAHPATITVVMTVAVKTIAHASKSAAPRRSVKAASTRIRPSRPCPH